MQYRSLTRQTAPAVEPVTLAEAKAHLRVDTSDDDALIQNLVQSAREWCEQYLDRTLVHTQWVMRFDKFPDSGIEPVELPRPPMVTSGTATTVTLTYTMETGGTATLSTSQYRVDRNSTPGAIKTNYAGVWPSHLQDDNSVTITYWAGYGPAGSDVPAAIRHAMLMLIGHWYDGARSGVLIGSTSKPLEFAIESLLSSQKWGTYR